MKNDFFFKVIVMIKIIVKSIIIMKAINSILLSKNIEDILLLFENIWVIVEVSVEEFIINLNYYIKINI